MEQEYTIPVVEEEHTIPVMEEEYIITMMEDVWSRNTPYTQRAEDVLYCAPLNVFYIQGFKTSDLAHLLTEDG